MEEENWCNLKNATNTFYGQYIDYFYFWHCDVDFEIWANGPVADLPQFLYKKRIKKINL